MKSLVNNIENIETNFTALLIHTYLNIFQNKIKFHPINEKRLILG